MRPFYCYQGIFIIPANIQAQVNGAVAQTADPVGGQFTFTVGLSASGDLPITHYVASSVLTERGLLSVAQLTQAFPTAKVYVWLATDRGTQEFLESTFTGISNATVGQVTIDYVLSLNNLKRIEMMP